MRQPVKRRYVYVVVHFAAAGPMQTGGVVECANDAEFFHLLAVWNAAPENALFKYSAAVPFTEAQHAAARLGGTFADVKERPSPFAQNQPA